MDAYRALRLASWMVVAGAVLSGPVAMVVVLRVAPQPAWSGVDPFVQHYHSIQGLPYLLGFLLLGGFVLFTAACHAAARGRHAVRTTAALVFLSIYGALVFTNYTLQVGLVPRLVPGAPDELSLLTMANPDSLAWFLEMFGYAALGVGLWLLAPLFTGPGRGRAIRWLLAVNAVASIAGAAAIATAEGWVFSRSGMASFLGWNVLVVACFLLLATAREEWGTGTDP
jgi:hypothetical protein